MPSFAQERELVIAQGVDVPGFDPHTHSNSAVEAVHVNLFDYLVYSDETGAFTPGLATDWERVTDTATRLRLREGVTFHDGSPFTAADVKFSLERPALDKSLRENPNFRSITSVEIVNDHEVLIHTAAADPILLNRLSKTGAGIVPKAYIDSVGWEAFSTRPIGTGPFKFVEWRRDDRLIMDAFAGHWRGAPVWDRLVHRTIPEASTRVAELISGGVDIAANIPSQDIQRVNGSGVAETAPWPQYRVMHMVVNMKEGSPLADPRVREAIDLAIDNQMLIDTVFDGLGVPLYGPGMPGISGTSLDQYRHFNFDPARAASLLKDAGYAPGELKIELLGSSGRYPLGVETLEIISVMLAEVGITAEIKILEWGVFSEQVFGRNEFKDIVFYGTGNSMKDMVLPLGRWTCGALLSVGSGWCDPEYDALMAKSAVELDPAKRIEYLSEASRRLSESHANLYLYQSENTIGLSKEIDWTPTPDELLWAYGVKPAAQ